MSGAGETLGGYFLSLGNGDRQLKNVWLTEVTVTLCSGLYKHDSNVLTNAGYTTITRAYSWKTKRVVHLGSNVPSTIFSIRDSLFHGTDGDALLLERGGEISITDSWFEGCETYVINKAGNNFLLMSLTNVYFENKQAPSDPNIRIWNLGANSIINIYGKTNSAFYTENPPTVGAGVELANYSQKAIDVICDGGVIATPESVNIHKETISIFNIPLGSAKDTGSGELLYSHTLNGGVASSFVESDTLMPSALKPCFAPMSGLNIIRGAVDTPNELVDGFAVFSFLYRSQNTTNGFNAGSTVTIDGSPIDLNTSFIFPAKADELDFICVVCVPVEAGSTVDEAFVKIRNKKYISVPDFKYITGVEMRASLGMPNLQRKRISSVLLPNTVATQLNIDGRYNDPYSFDGSVVLDGGLGGKVVFTCAGEIKSGSKNSNDTDITSASYVAAVTDGGNSNAYRVTIINNSGSDSIAELQWNY